ncbi:MAG: hypothetical protein HYZ58_11680 [Acidobacteria bacterium]|nr:hypothetical protein [Acidobacteriota bacterium]
MYATGSTVDQFLNLSVSREPVDVYVRLQFSEQDIHRIKGEFFGYSYYDDDEEPGDPYERYVPPEGKAMLLFSKAAA